MTIHSPHGGDIYRNRIQYDFSVNLNPLGMPAGVVRVLRSGAGDWGCYPDPECRGLVEKLAAVHQVPPDYVLCGNGAADLIFQTVQAAGPSRALVPVPTFSEYGRALEAAGCRIQYAGHGGMSPGALVRKIRDSSADWDMLFFCNPNNPTGTLTPVRELVPLLNLCRSRKIRVVVDECFCGLVEHPREASVLGLVREYENLVVVRAFTKTFAMAGLRLGYVVTRDRDLLEKMRALRQPWSVSVPAQKAGEAALLETRYLEKSRRLIAGERVWLAGQLKALGFGVYPSAANYLLFRDLSWEGTPARGQNRGSQTGRPGSSASGSQVGNNPAIQGTLWETLAAKGILIRDCANFRGLGPGYYRVCISTRKRNRILVKALKAVLNERK